MERQTENVEHLGSINQLQRYLRELQCRAKNYAVILYAGDNGVSWEGTSRYAPMHSGSIVSAHLERLAPTAFFLDRIGRPEFIADVGLYEHIDHPALIDCKVTSGSRNFLYGDALTPDQVEEALASAPKLWEHIDGSRFDIIGIGEIGIGDTLCAAAIASVLTGNNPGYVTGCGSSDDKVIGQKIDIIDKAIAQRCPEINIIDLLSRFGGLEIAGLTGFILKAVEQGVPVMLDGYVTAVAALLASLKDKRVGRYVIAPSLALEKGHQIVLNELGVKPVFSFDFNYGEGLVAAIGLLMAELSCALYNN